MNAPTYTWVCHKCEKPNQPHTDKCASCGFQAIASAMDINPETTEQKRQRFEIKEPSMWLFFPEGLVAGVLVLFSPLWAIKLILNGHYLAALCLVAVVAVFSYGFIWAIQTNRMYLAYWAMIGFLVGVLGIYTALTS